MYTLQWVCQLLLQNPFLTGERGGLSNCNFNPRTQYIVGIVRRKTSFYVSNRIGWTSSAQKAQQKITASIKVYFKRPEDPNAYHSEFSVKVKK